MKQKYILNVRADHAPDLLTRVLVMLSRRRISMESVMMSKTDINGQLNISGEIMIDAADTANLEKQLEKIIEVFRAVVLPADRLVSHKLAFFKLSTAMLENDGAACLQKYGAQMIKMESNAFIISKSGSDDVIRELYNKLEGIHLLGFSQTGILTDSPLLENDDEWRISGLAA